MTTRLYQAVRVIDKIDGIDRYGCIVDEIFDFGHRVFCVKFEGCVSPKENENGELCVSIGMKKSYYLEDDVKMIDESFNFEVCPNFFNTDPWQEKDDLYQSILKSGKIRP